MLRTATILFLAISAAASASEPIDIGGRREPLVDDYLIERFDGAELRLQQPIPRQVAIVHDKPWEGNICAYHTVMQDGDLYRLYYRGGHYDPQQKKQTHEQLYCYAESPDGIHWTRPTLGIHAYQGSKQNNIIIQGIGSHNFAPFKDVNPDCPPEARYKAVGNGPGGMHAFQSADGIHWSPLSDDPVITEGAFDSQNVAFWDAARQRYVDFHRDFRNGVRDIKTCTSKDFLEWTDPDWIEYPGVLPEHLYTNAITAHPQAPHIFIGFPKRFVPSRNPTGHPYAGVSDGVFMSSRDGKTFRRWRDAFLRPGPQPDRWVNRNNMIAWGIVTTASDEPGAPDELSLYATEGYYQGKGVRLRRYTVRQDGFVSAYARATGGEVVTKLFTFRPDDATQPDHRPKPPESIVRRESKRPISGQRSLDFDQPAVIDLPGTQNLGSEFTLAAHVRDVPAGHRRLFSAYNGGSPAAGELYFDFDAHAESGVEGAAIRFALGDLLVTVPAGSISNWSVQAGDDKPHHLAVTWKQGMVAIYFDGKRVAEGGSATPSPLQLALGDLRFGEDYPPTHLDNEPFLGTTDNILVLRRALSDAEMTSLAAGKITDAIRGHEENGLFLAADEEGIELVDRATQDGVQVARLPKVASDGRVQLRLNFATSAAGSVRCEIQDAAGRPIPGYSLAENDELFGDRIDQVVRWGGSGEVEPLVGQPIRLRFVLSDADLYSLQFRGR